MKPSNIYLKANSLLLIYFRNRQKKKNNTQRGPDLNFTIRRKEGNSHQMHYTFGKKHLINN